MTYSAKILADSQPARSEARLVSMEVTFPRFILAEFNTHRVFSRNSASSRAIPVEKRIEQVRKAPFVPEAFTKNKRGMQAEENIGGWKATLARWIWLLASKCAVMLAWCMSKLGVHKQHANRLLEPFCWHTVVVTATEWDNFFALRTDKTAQPEMQITAKLMLEAYEKSTPRELHEGMWHLPYVTDEEWAALDALAHDPKDPERKAWESLRNSYVMCSVVRCAAVSFERQNALRPLADIIVRHDNLAAAGHWSPFEHQAKVAEKSKGERPRPGNFRPPWTQYRKMFDGEAVWRKT